MYLVFFRLEHKAPLASPSSMDAFLDMEWDPGSEAPAPPASPIAAEVSVPASPIDAESDIDEEAPETEVL